MPMDVLKVLARHVKRAGNQKEAAKALGISAQYLNDLIQGRREPSDAVLEKLNLRRVIVRVKAKNG